SPCTFIREGEDQGELHDTVDPPETVDVVGEHIVLDEAPVLRLILRHDAVIRIVHTRRQVAYLSSPYVLGAFGSDDFIGNPQSMCAVDAASVLSPTPLVVGVLIDDIVAEEARGLRPGVRDQGLLV